MKQALTRIKNIAGLVKRKKAQVGKTPAQVVHTENKWKLLRYTPRPEGLKYKTPILLIPKP